jgi:hypothetical protein
MFSLSVGVYQRKFGGLAEFAAATKLAVETLLLMNVFEQVLAKAQLLGFVLEYARNGKWSDPLGQPSAQ